MSHLQLTASALVLLFVLGTGVAYAGSGKDGPDDNKGGGNEPHAPGQTSNPNPGKLFDEGPEWLAGFVVANVAPGSGNWGGGRGNSGPGDQNGNNNQGSGGQTPPGQDDK